MDWIDMKRLRWLEIMRLFNRFTAMSPDKLPRKVLTWDYKSGGKRWLSDVLKVCASIDIPMPTELRYIYDLEPIERKFLVQCRKEWKTAASTMSKLCTYVEIKDFEEVGVLVQANLPRNECSLLSRLLCGILPLEVETGRFKKKLKAIRLCRTCLQKCSRR